MAVIYRYVKAPDVYTTHTLDVPPDAGVQELCTLDDGYTYVSVPEGVELPGQMPAIAGTLEPATMDDALREAVKAASPQCWLIAERVIGRIREKYSTDDELYIARIAVGALQGTYTMLPGEAGLIAQYQADVEAAREWGRQQREALGL